MSIFVPHSPSGYTIFCDEVRQEIGGKLLFIGVYSGDMVVFGAPPFAMRSFTAVVNYLERPGESHFPVKLKLFAPGSETAVSEFELSLDEARAQFNAVAAPPGEDPMLKSLILMQVSPLIITEPGLIKVRAYRGSDEFRLGTLNVIFQSPPGGTA